MVNYMLMISADLENLTNLQPNGGQDDPDFPYFLKVKCGWCGELRNKEICTYLDVTVPLSLRKGIADLVLNCKFCERKGTVTMIPDQGRPLTLEASESGNYRPLMLFDCRGFEPLDFHSGYTWKVKSLAGTKYEDIDLSRGYFVEYDEKGECPVMISNLRYKFKPYWKIPSKVAEVK